MCPDANDPLARQLALLRQLEGRGLARASDFFARLPDGDAPPPPRSGRACFDHLFPAAERLASDACAGACRCVRSEAPFAGRPTAQGYLCPAEPFGGPPRSADLAALTGDRRWADVDPARIVYLDTETTGLSTGTGTYTFLIGLGRFEGERFIVEQYFMEDYADEAAIIAAVDPRLAEAQALVSYNGLTFDVPLLETRWRLQRRRPRFPDLHLDLLHYARRLWRLRLPDCSLATVEQQILDITRLSDVDGSWVPRIYFDFTRGLRPERIVPVFDHHAQDIYSLGALAAAVLRAWNHPDDARFAEAQDQWGLARLYTLRGRADEALARMEAAVLAARDEEFGFRLAMHLAKAYKRRGRTADAVAVWESRAKQAAPGRLDPLLELAMHAEHGLKDFAAARRWAECALDIIRSHAELRRLTRSMDDLDDVRNGSLSQQLAALGHRVDRLVQRHARAEQKGRPKKRTLGPDPLDAPADDKI